MPKYILLTTLTTEGARTLHGSAERLLAVNKEIEAFGCTLDAQFATLGQYDFVTILDAPDNETVAHLSADLASRGTVKIQTLPAMTIANLIENMRGPNHMGRD